VNDILARMKKGMDIREAIANIPILVRSPEEAAQKYIKQILANAFVPDEQRGALLHGIGRASPPVWWDEVVTYISYRDSERVRREAAVALEQLGEKKAADPLLQRFPQEPSDSVKGEILRALGRTGGGNKKAAALLQEVLTKARPKPWPEELRLQATLALVPLEDRPTAVALLQAALKDSAAKVRSAALYALATRREKDQLPMLKAGLPGEQDKQVLADLAATVAVLEGGDGKYFADYLKRVAGDLIERDRH
jgi:HEAT repeat protein